MENEWFSAACAPSNLNATARPRPCNSSRGSQGVNLICRRLLSNRRKRQSGTRIDSGDDGKAVLSRDVDGEWSVLKAGGDGVGDDDVLPRHA
jgi:hypothetical protein